jgi:hypothetical protein
MFAQRVREIVHIACRQIEAFGAGWRNYVRGISRKKKPAEPHRLSDKTAKRGDAFLDGWPGNQLIHRALIEAAPEFIPKPVV